MTEPSFDLKAQAEGLVIPNHLAVVMDGNGRWAQQRGLPRLAGHYEGRKASKRMVAACGKLGVKALSLYAFSTENWSRPEEEVSGLMDLIEHAIHEELRELDEANVIFRASGRLHEVPPSLQETFRYGRELTADNTGLTLNLCVNYGGRAEIVDTTRTLARAAQSGALAPEDIGEEHFQSHLYAPDLPNVDLLLRPGGEMRVSNFLLWESAYAEIVVMTVLWPDFQEEHLLEAIRTFNARQRRFGRVGE